jgi:hypothetical protein
MAYGEYSEVYYANNTRPNQYYHNKILVKIGETTNTRRRSNQLTDVSIATWCSLEKTSCGYNHSARLFVESYLRGKVCKLPNVEQSDVDYFWLPNKDTDKFIVSHFVEWVQEAVALWEKM